MRARGPSLFIFQQEREGGPQGAGDGLGVAEDLALGAQLGLLPGADLRGVDLGGVEAQQVDALAAGAVVAGQALQPLGEPGVLVEGCRDPRQQRLGLGAAAAVEQAALELGLDQPQLVALAVDAQQVRGEVGEQPQGGGLVVDEDAVAAASGDLAADQHLPAIGVQPCVARARRASHPPRARRRR